MPNALLELRKFVVPEIIFGVDARLLVSRYISHFNAKNPMLVTDKDVQDFEWFHEILTLIHPQVEKLFIFNEITPNPKDIEAMLGANLFLSQGCDLIIAIGGGSAIDCAKCISIVASNGGNILDYEGVDEVKMPGPPLICIPTTAGSSADVSQFAIIKDTSTNIKRTIISKKVVPDLALIDPVPLMTMPHYLTACTAMDALTHAIEAYVSNTHSALSDVHALEAIRLINSEIENAVSENRTIETMSQLMLGSLQAGFAFSNASLGAVHAMSHSMGGLLGLPHGECNSILLEHVIRINFETVPERYREIAKKLDLSIDNVSDSVVLDMILNRIVSMRENVHIPAAVKVNNLDETMVNYLVENALNDPCMVTNPRMLTKEEVRIIYERVLQQKK